MIPEITQANVHIFIPLKAAKIAGRLSRERNLPSREALLEFYRSRTYQALEQENTKCWYESPEQLYEDFKRNDG